MSMIGRPSSLTSYVCMRRKYAVNKEKRTSPLSFLRVPSPGGFAFPNMSANLSETPCRACKTTLK